MRILEFADMDAQEIEEPARCHEERDRLEDLGTFGRLALFAYALDGCLDRICWKSCRKALRSHVAED